MGTLLGSYKIDSIPFLASLAIRLGWLRHRYARYYVSTLEVYDDGIRLLARRAGGQDQSFRWADIRRVWFEQFHSASGRTDCTNYRIDIIAHNLDVIFSLTEHDCPLQAPQLQLMQQLHDLWRKATWRHYHVVAAVIKLASGITQNGLPDDGEIRYLCMQKPDTRYAYTSRHWEFPGGKVEEGETEPQALRRELREEMDYEVQVTSHLTTIEHTYPDFSLSLSCWLCEASDITFNRHEHIDHRWLTADEMQALDWCAADFPVIELLKTL